MKPSLVVLTALAASVMLVSVAGAGPAAKQRVAINMKLHTSTFVLAPLSAGAVRRDSGRLSESGTGGVCRDVIRDGQKVGICPAAWALAGKQGTLTLRASQEWVDAGSGGCGVAFGTWKVVRGTGAYAGVSGGGRSAYDAHCSKWYARHEGFLTSP